MRHLKRKYSLSVLLIYLLISTQIVFGQTQVEVPKEIKIEINNDEKILTEGWLDSLYDDAYSGEIHYKILGAKRFEYFITTNLQIPQILSLDDALRQIIIYYSLLPGEDARDRELVHVFQFFEPTTSDPAIRAKCHAEGEFEFEISRWNQVPIPSAPIPEDKDIYNQIVQTSFKNVQTFGEVPEKVFKKIALENNLEVERVKIIYQNTLLWKVSTQISK